jgi:hypothetical protein
VFILLKLLVRYIWMTRWNHIQNRICIDYLLKLWQPLVHPDVLIYILPLFAKTKPLLVHLDVLNIVIIGF